MNNGLYEGDIFYDILEEHLEKKEISRHWKSVCEELGYASYREQDESKVQRSDQFVRLLNVVVSARVEFLDDFDEIVADTVDSRAFLQVLLRASRSRGREMYSVPTDILTFLILRRGGEFLTKGYIRETLHFDARIAEALIDTLIGVGQT